MKWLVALLLIGTIFSPVATYAAAAPKTPPPPPPATELKIFAPTGALVSALKPFEGAGQTASSVAVGDLGKDGSSEIVVGAGPGNKPWVRVLRLDGSLITEFLAYAEGMKSGVNVALCDLTGDGTREIVVGAGVGGGPQVRVFKNDGQFNLIQFFAYDEAFRSGVNIACGDVDGDGLAEIITGAGPGGGPDVKIFDRAGRLKATQTLANVPAGAGSLVFTGNIDADPKSEILAYPAANGAFDVAVIDHTTFGYTGTSKMTGFLTASYGISAAVDQKALFVSSGAYAPRPELKNVSTGVSFIPFPNTPEVAPKIAIIPETGNIVALAAANTMPLDPASQFVQVDISDQKLRAYVNGLEIKTFLVSTGKRGYSTPIGKTIVKAKIPIMTYAWSYGPDNPNNYSLPNVKWNMRVFPHIYIHSAYWHNNFGRPMSHGCINMSIPDAEWMYGFTSVGTPVETVP